MEIFKKLVFVALSALCFTFCASNHHLQMMFPQEITKAYYETSLEDNHRQVNFHIEFKEPLSAEIHLQKVYFRNQEAVIEKVSDNKYVAHFPQTSMPSDFILDSDSKKEYGNIAPIIVKPKFKINKDEAVLEYRKNNESIFFKLLGIIEKQ